MNTLVVVFTFVCSRILFFLSICVL
uniref:Uncharacterized protein n=1 Tax=Rhizophora mucronata TaxID=61149 RepID=A0A2P2J1S2_RHIMU